MKNYFFRCTAIFILILSLGVGTAWADEITVYVTGEIFIGTGEDAWDNATSTIKVDVRKGHPECFDCDGFNGLYNQDMTNTGYTYNGYPIYSYTLNQAGAQFRFKHYKSGVFKENYTTDWHSTTNQIYRGYYDKAHHWATYGRDVTFYATPEKMDGSKWEEGTHSLFANFKYGDGESEWKRQQMTKTAYTYNGNAIYTCTMLLPYNVIKKVQFLYNDGSDKELYAYEPSPQLTAGNIDGKIFRGYISDIHTWATYGRDVTVYTVPEYLFKNYSTKFSEDKHSPSVCVQYGVGVSEWKTINMVKTDYTYDNYPIWKATFLLDYNIFKEFQIKYFDKANSQQVGLYQYNQGGNTEYPSSDLDDKLYHGYNGSSHDFFSYRYDVALDMQSGGGGSTSIIAIDGSAMPSATMPGRDGYAFGGYWTETNGGGTQYYNSDGSSTRNWDSRTITTLYAHWTPEPYTVTLEGMEADSEDPILVNVTYDDVLPSLETKHTKAHYDLLGYWAASDDHGEYLTDQLIDANGNWIPDVTGYTGNDRAGHPTWVHDFNISLFAQWTEHSYTVTTSVSPAGAGTLSCGSSVTAQWVTPSELITATANPAWKFVRWEYGENVGPADGTGNDNTVQIKASVNGTLTAVFEPRFCLVGSIWNDSGNGGMPGYSDYTIDFMVNSTSPINLTCVRKLDPNKTFKFQVHDRKRNMNLGNTPAGGYIGDASLECSIQDRDIPFVTTGHGDYTFTISEIRQDGDAYYPTVSVSGPPSHLVNLSWADVDIDGNWWKTSRSTGGTVAAVATESGDTNPISNGQYVAQGGSITYTATPAPGYRFGGWWNTNWDYKFSDTNPLPHSSISAIENVEGKFEENYTTVTINTNNTRGGTITVGGEAFTWGSTKTAGVTTKRALVVTENTGYTFTHWTLSNTPDFELQDKASADKEVTLAGLGGTNGSSGTLTANFTAKTYNITLNDDQGGEHNGSATISYDATSLSVTNHASIDGWMRLGYWNSAGNKVSDADGKLEANVPDYTNSSKEWNYDDDVTLWAHWYRIVTLDKNGGSDNGTIGVDYKGYSSSLSRPTRNGYSIEGFYAESGCTTKVMNPDGTLVKNVSGYTDSDGKWIHKTADRLYTKWIFVIYRTGDKAEDPRAQNTDVESYEGGTIEKAIEFRMKVQTIDQWYSLSLPFAVSSVKVWDDEDGRYYDIVPYYRTDGKFYTGHYIIRKPEKVTNYAIETFEEKWVDPENSAVLPEKNIPYIIQWHNPYFLGKYISFFGSTNQAIPSDFNAGEAPSADDVVNVFGNNTMHSGTVMDAYLLDKDYGPSGAWLREDIGTDRTILPFECFIRASQQGTARYRIIRRGMEIDMPTALEQISNHQSPMTIRVYTITGVLIGEYNDCSFQDAAHRIATDHNEGIYILRSENESMKLLFGGK